MSDPAVLVQGLGKTWPGPTEALRSVDLQVAAGEVVVLLGANGSGKSTLLGILAGLVHATRGTAHLFGISVDSPAARQRLGYTPESPSLPPRATPYDLLVVAARLSGRSPADAARHTAEWLDRLDLGAAANRPIGTLSQGTRERVALAQALVHGPDVALLDEPMTGLDTAGRARVLDALTALKARGMGLLVATHWPEVFAGLADRTATLRDGVVVLA